MYQNQQPQYQQPQRQQYQQQGQYQQPQGCRQAPPQQYAPQGQQGENLYVGSGKVRNGQYGPMQSFSFNEQDLRKMLAHLNENGWVTIDIKQRQQPSPTGATQYATINLWRPQNQGGYARQEQYQQQGQPQQYQQPPPPAPSRPAPPPPQGQPGGYYPGYPTVDYSNEYRGSQPPPQGQQYDDGGFGQPPPQGQPQQYQQPPAPPPQEAHRYGPEDCPQVDENGNPIPF